MISYIVIACVVWILIISAIYWVICTMKRTHDMIEAKNRDETDFESVLEQLMRNENLFKAFVMEHYNEFSPRVQGRANALLCKVYGVPVIEEGLEQPSIDYPEGDC